MPTNGATQVSNSQTFRSYYDPPSLYAFLCKLAGKWDSSSIALLKLQSFISWSFYFKSLAYLNPFFLQTCWKKFEKDGNKRASADMSGGLTFEKLREKVTLTGEGWKRWIYTDKNKDRELGRRRKRKQVRLISLFFFVVFFYTHFSSTIRSLLSIIISRFHDLNTFLLHLHILLWLLGILVNTSPTVRCRFEQ